jgi:hypothetical protein
VNTVISETQNAVGKPRLKATICFAITIVYILSKFQVYEQTGCLSFESGYGKIVNKQTQTNL